MSANRIPDPTLMARLEISGEDVEWAASLVRPWQHEEREGHWSPHAQVWHLLDVERSNYQPRITRILNEDRPIFQPIHAEARLREHYDASPGIDDLARQFAEERAKTVGLFKGLTPEQWQRTGVWPDGREIDLAWLAERALWHALEHFASLLAVHQEFEPRQSLRWIVSP